MSLTFPQKRNIFNWPPLLSNIMDVFLIQVTVIITDINDNNPVIQQTDPVAVSVVEHSALGEIVTIISAVDVHDYGSNAEVTYSITSGNTASECHNVHSTVLSDLLSW